LSDILNLNEQIEIAVSLAEGQFREFKSALQGPPSQKVKRSIRSICQDVGEALVAFANADGGELLIGVGLMLEFYVSNSACHDLFRFSI
jgi:ATP-dependent DNA helicase RecG